MTIDIIGKGLLKEDSWAGDVGWRQGMGCRFGKQRQRIISTLPVVQDHWRHRGFELVVLQPPSGTIFTGRLRNV